MGPTLQFLYYNHILLFRRLWWFLWICSVTLFILMYCYVHIHHNGQLISFVIQPRETSDLKAMYGDLRKYLFNITSHLDTTYFDMVKEEACIIKPRPSFPAYQIKQEGNSTKNTTNRCAAFHYEGSRSRTAIFNYLAPPDSELVSESFSHHTTHIMCMERHFQTQ